MKFHSFFTLRKVNRMETGPTIQERTRDYYNSRREDLNHLLSQFDGYLHHHSGIFFEDIICSEEMTEEKLLYQIHQSENMLVTYNFCFLLDFVGATGLDAGCGRGGSSFMLINNLNCSMTGITICPYQMEYIENEIKKKNLNDKFLVSCMDYMKTDFEDSKFDFVWMCESSEHSPDIYGLMKEMYRVTRLGGKLILIAWTYNPDHQDASIYKTQVDQKYQTNIWSIKDYREAIKNAGWETIANEDMTAYTLRYWKLRQMSKNKTGTEDIFVGGYGCGALLYHIFCLRKPL